MRQITTNHRNECLFLLGAGRLIKEGAKTYHYGYLDKILNVVENGATTATFDYHINGQIASATNGDKTINFLWDGLALIQRGDTTLVNEPAITGGNPILANGKPILEDMLGTSLGTLSDGKFLPNELTSFGEPVKASDDNYFTGKPYIGELGYAFLFRNYRPEKGKWQTQDPIGYPDGWNNFSYVNNQTITKYDPNGLCTYIDTWGNEHKYDWKNPPSDALVKEIKKCKNEEKWVPDKLTNVPTGSMTIDCGSSHTFVLINSNYNGEYKYITQEYSYNCGQTSSSHLGSVDVYYTYTLNLEKKKIVYECGHSENVEGSPVKFVSLTNIEAHISNKKACAE